MFHPKVFQYHADGTGRDWHCFGRVINPNPAMPQMNTTITYNDRKPMVSRKSPELLAKRHADGTGRDSYIITDNGGLYHTYK